MKRIISWGALVFLCLTFGFVMPKRDLTANQEIFDNSSNYVPNELLVKFKDDTEAFNIRQELNIIQAKIITYLGKQIDVPEWNAEAIQRRSFPLNSNLFHLKVPEGIGTEWALQALKLSPNVEYAQKNYIYHFCDIKGKALRDEGPTS